jgi:hypothetical protein
VARKAPPKHLAPQQAPGVDPPNPSAASPVDTIRDIPPDMGKTTRSWMGADAGRGLAA